MPVLESNNNAEAEVPLQGSGDVCIMNIITANCPQKNTLISCPAEGGFTIGHHKNDHPACTALAAWLITQSEITNLFSCTLSCLAKKLKMT